MEQSVLATASRLQRNQQTQTIIIQLKYCEACVDILGSDMHSLTKQLSGTIFSVTLLRLNSGR
jgi:hypothetical protein